MNNFKKITKDIESFKKFAEENEWAISCENCIEDEDDCCGDCFKNLFIYLKSCSEDEVLENEISKKEFTVVYNMLKKISAQPVIEYNDVNYIEDILKRWKRDKKSLNNQQKMALNELKDEFNKRINHLNKVQELFNSIDNQEI